LSAGVVATLLNLILPQEPVESNEDDETSSNVEKVEHDVESQDEKDGKKL
jgi:hypothetical protein